jgi:hypothetical protein
MIKIVAERKYVERGYLVLGDAIGTITLWFQTHKLKEE